MKELVAHFIVVDGKMQFVNRNFILTNIPMFEGCRGEITIKKKWSQRTRKQNGLYFTWVEIIAETFGYPKEKMHNTLKEMFGVRDRVVINGKSYTSIKSTSEYTKGEMVEYMFDIETWASQEGLVLPKPEDISQLPELINEDETINNRRKKSL